MGCAASTRNQNGRGPYRHLSKEEALARIRANGETTKKSREEGIGGSAKSDDDDGTHEPLDGSFDNPDELPDLEETSSSDLNQTIQPKPREREHLTWFRGKERSQVFTQASEDLNSPGLALGESPPFDSGVSSDSSADLQKHQHHSGGGMSSQVSFSPPSVTTERSAATSKDLVDAPPCIGEALSKNPSTSMGSFTKLRRRKSPSIETSSSAAKPVEQSSSPAKPAAVEGPATDVEHHNVSSLSLRSQDLADLSHPGSPLIVGRPGDGPLQSPRSDGTDNDTHMSLVPVISVDNLQLPDAGSPHHTPREMGHSATSNASTASARRRQKIVQFDDSVSSLANSTSSAHAEQRAKPRDINDLSKIDL